MLALPSRITDAVLEVPLIQPGCGTAIPDGLIHNKTAPCLIVAQATQGSYEVECRGQRILARSGEAFLAATHEPLKITHHADRRKGNLMNARWLHVHFTLFGTIDISSLLNIPLKCNRAYGSLLGEIIQELLINPSHNGNSLAWMARRKELAFRTLAIICQISTLKKDILERLGNVDRLADLFSFIRKNLFRPIQVKDLAEAIHISIPRIYSIFRTQTQCSPMEYIKQLRLMEASHRLIFRDDSVAQVGESVGFRNQFHFSREFKKKFGVPPLVYRQQTRL